jgi:peroxin-1
MQSKGKPAPVVGRDGLAGSRGSTVTNIHTLPTVEVDATFAQVVGLTEGMKVHDLSCSLMNLGG